MFNAELVKLNKDRNLARKMFQNSRNPALKRILNKLNKKIIKLSEKIENESLNNKLVNINTYDGKLWNFVKSFKSKKQNIPTLNDTANIALTDIEKANCLANSLETQFTLYNISDINTENSVKRFVENFRILNVKCADTDLPSPSEVLGCIKKLKNNKAPGIDSISNMMIRNLSHNVIFYLTFLFQKILTLGHFPQRWKTATVVPILKPGKDPTQPSSYRPISLLSSISKIAENIILTRFNKHLTDNNILCNEQFGFRPNLSNSHQLLRVAEFVYEGFTNKQKTGAVFLDIQKAFDRVWQDALIHKIISYNTPTYLNKIIDSYLQNRNFCVKVNNELSDLKNIAAGVAQGSKLGPILFSCFINDIPKQFNTLFCMYADDTAILARHKNPNFIKLALDRHIHALEGWFIKWKITINATKTEAIMFHKNWISNMIHKFPRVKIQNKIIPWSKEVKYLGVILDPRLTWKPHFLYVRCKFWANTRKLFPLIARNSRLDREAKILIYTAYLRPILTYAALVWGCAANTNLKILEVLQNKTIRTICNATWYMSNTDIRKDLKYPSLRDFIKKLSANFFKNINLYDNPAIKDIASYSPNIKIKRPRNVLL
ncbi:RNA-directed DNA polymerase from mobile element jockey [Araneus ventricosus]|uniref:RNA-directed DNA polymerase from mobile element jockey n=1 Tax=Araneus ventricosus TaxID=182803 RepID=A0A4Y2G8I2_ARAVE|nr:RNA-directed DNA polymerase from mobile element jockey [Araneus ventricosus]